MKIDNRAWNAIRQFAAKKDVRYYLKAVHVVSDGRTARLEATDGLVAAVYSWDLEEPGAELDVLITPEKLPSNRVFHLSVEPEHAWFSGQKLTVHADLVDARYPDLGRVTPNADQCSGEPADFDARLLARAYKAFADIVPGKMPVRTRLHFNGLSGARIDSPDVPGLVVVVTPLRPPEE